MKPCLTITLLLLYVPCCLGQFNIALARAHSHNDYEQSNPFYLAYTNGFGSIEADIHLKNGQLLVGHDASQLNATRSLELLYLIPLSQELKSDTPSNPFHPLNKKLQLLIDVKTSAEETLDTLVQLLLKYPQITENPLISICISGNRPPPHKMLHYPRYIKFDGRLEETYSHAQWKRISMISDTYAHYIIPNPKGFQPVEVDTLKIRKAIAFAHQHHKPFRFWGNPDQEVHWKFLWNEGVDYINTDQVERMRVFLEQQL